MQLKNPADLQRALAQTPLPPAWFLVSEDPLLLQEACDRVLQQARGAGYLEREIHTVEPGFDWAALEQSGASMSLFASRKIIDLRIPTGRPGDAGTRVLEGLLQQAGDDTLLLVRSSNWEPAVRKLKWVRLLQKQAHALVLWPLKPHEFLPWVEQRMRACGLQPEAAAVEALAMRTEGNLLACDQEIRKLHLFLGEGPVYSHQIDELVADSARFDAFRLVEVAMQGQARRAVEILAHIRAEGLAPHIVHWALNQRIQVLADLALAGADAAARQRVFDQHRIWRSQQAMLERLARKHKPGRWYALLQESLACERILKGRQAGDGWLELERLVLALADQPLPKRPKFEPV